MNAELQWFVIIINDGIGSAVCLVQAAYTLACFALLLFAAFQYLKSLLREVPRF